MVHYFGPFIGLRSWSWVGTKIFYRKKFHRISDISRGLYTPGPTFLHGPGRVDTLPLIPFLPRCTSKTSLLSLIKDPPDRSWLLNLNTKPRYKDLQPTVRGQPDGPDRILPSRPISVTRRSLHSGHVFSVRRDPGSLDLGMVWVTSVSSLGSGWNNRHIPVPGTRKPKIGYYLPGHLLSSHHCIREPLESNLTY